MTGPYRYERNPMTPDQVMRLKAVDRAIHLADVTEADWDAAKLTSEAEVIRQYIAGGTTVIKNVVKVADPAAVEAITRAQQRFPKPGEHLRGVR
ncbi:hypothetical protein ACXYTP_23535 [Tsukamurella ocularis]